MILDTLISEQKYDELCQDLDIISNNLDELNKKNYYFLELDNQYSQNRNEIKALNKQLINTRNLTSAISELNKKLKFLISKRNYFVDELEKRSNAIEKYSDKRGYLLTKEERKEKDNLDLQLAPLIKLENELLNATNKNNEIDNNIKELEKKNWELALKLQRDVNENKTILLQIESENNKLNILKLYQKNQNILKKCIPYIKEKDIIINDDDDYEDIKNKCILDYADDLVYTGTMTPLCSNVECTGVTIGEPCNCKQNNNIWFTVNKPDKHEKYITVDDDVFFPESTQPLGYLINRDCSIDDYTDYSNKYDIWYDNYTDLFILVNTHHHDTLRERYCVLSKDYPKDNNNYNPNYKCDDHCYYYINSNSWTCMCGKRQFVWEDENFDPMNHSLLKTMPNGYLRDEY